MVIYFQSIRSLHLLKLPMRSAIVTQIMNTRTLRSQLSMKPETLIEKEPISSNKSKNVKPKGKASLEKKSDSAVKNVKGMQRDEQVEVKTELEAPLKIEPQSDYEGATKNEKLKSPKLQKQASKSPRKRKQTENALNAEKVVKLETLTKDIEDVWQPENWREVLDNILKMRKLHVAPVDSLGCEECPEKGVTPEVFRYQTLISVMLSSQTRDEVTFAATQRLIEHGLNVDSILETPDEKIGELIYPAGFWKSKIKFIKNTTKILKHQYNGDIPRTFKELCKLPGVGPKMANIVMSVAWNDTVGIAVDTHVHRIANRLGWVPKPTKEPEQTRKALESWLPKNLWKEASLDLVGFGQTLCKPIKPKCNECLNNVLCPSSTCKKK